MKKNEYGAPLDRNGYAPSILFTEERCFICGKRNVKLDRHEPFGGPYREKSKNYGMWVLLCSDGCHEGSTGVHGNVEKAEKLRRHAQSCAMREYGWSVEEFIVRFGKNHL